MLLYQMRKHILTLIIFMGTLLSVTAQPLASYRFEERSFSLGGGYADIIDTYLSPLNYNGANVMLMGEHFSQTALSSNRWYTQSLFSLHGDYVMPRSGSGLMVGGMVDYSRTYYYRIRLKEANFSVYVGSQGQLRMGGIYNLRNSNNPAQLKLGVNAAVSAMAKYVFLLGDLPMNIRLQADLPLLGVAFGPDYGQSYYEIFYLGESEGCVHTTSLHNNLSIRTNISCDIQLVSCTLRFILANDFYQWTLKGQYYRMGIHSIMLGYVKNLYQVVRDDRVRQYIPY